MFSLFNKDYSLKKNNIENSIAVRRLQNSIQQFALYESSIKEILSNLNDEGKLKIDDAENLLKLIFEYLALADNILRYGKAFIKVEIPDAISHIRFTVDLIGKSFDDQIEPDSNGTVSQKRSAVTLLEDINLLLNYWGK